MPAGRLDPSHPRNHTAYPLRPATAWPGRPRCRTQPHGIPAASGNCVARATEVPDATGFDGRGSASHRAATGAPSATPRAEPTRHGNRLSGDRQGLGRTDESEASGPAVGGGVHRILPVTHDRLDRTGAADALTVAAGSYKVLFTAFPVEAYGTAANRVDLVNRTRTWFGTP